MADIITRLKIESGEYDSKIKRAVSGLQNMEQECRRVDGTLAILEKDQKQYVQSLGQMQTVSNTVRGKISELTSAYTELRAQYNRLTEEEKKGDFGKALSSSLDQLKQRISDSKKELNDIQKDLNATGNESNSTGSILDQLSQKFTINFDAVKLFNTALKAADGAMQVAKDAFFASEATVDEWGRTVEASRSLYEGFLTALNNSDISGYLARMDQIVEAARQAYNELDRLGTMKTIQGPAISAQQTENDRMRQMIMTGRYIAPVDGRNAAPGMVNGQQLTAEQIRAIERNLQGGMQKIVTLVGNEVKQTSKAIDARYSLMAKENGMTLKEFRQGTSSMAEFDKRIKAAAEYDKYERAHTTTSTRINPTSGDAETVVLRDNTKNPYEAYKNWSTFRVDKMGTGSYNDLVNLIKQRDQQAAQAYSMQSQAYRTINRAEGTTVRDIMNGKTGGSGGGTGGGRSLSAPEQADAKYVQAQKDYEQSLQQAALEVKAGTINSAEAKKKELQAAETLWKSIGDAREVYDSPKLKEAQANVEAKIVALGPEVDKAIEAQKESEKAARELESKQKALSDAIGNRSKAVGENSLKSYYQANDKVVAAGGQAGALIPVEFTATQDNIAAVISELKEGVASSDIGTETFNKLTEQLSDATALGGIISEMVKQGVDTADFSEAINSMWAQLKEGDIDDSAIQTFLEKVNAQIKEQGGIQLDMNANTGEVTQRKKGDDDALKETQKVVSGLSQVASGLQAMGIILPSEVTKVLSMLQGAMTVVQGVSTIVSVFGSTSMAANSAAVGANTVSNYALMGSIVALKAAIDVNTASSWIPFAEGGVIPKFAEGGVIQKFANGGLIGKAAGGMLIPGNSYSGDLLRMPVDGGRGVIGVNSGELILNTVQQNNLANALEGGGLESMSLSTVITAEDIKLILNNNGERIGVGEYFKM